MTDDVRGSGGPPAGAGDAPPVPGVSTAARAQPAVDQSFDGDSLYAVRATVAAHASEAGIQEGRVRNVVLAVHELAANVVRHGAGQGRMRLWVTGDGIRCEVTDAGTPPAGAGAGAGGDGDGGDGGDGDGDGCDGGDGADTGFRDAALWPVEHGHGLWLVREVADQVSLESGPSGTVAVVSFHAGSQERAVRDGW
ncbi:MAG TPA: ATP-binding protein [Streptosporangiaceae bacterium]|nr:ATP-binding protein [Streptosporangiaceae bacterium]